MSTTKVLNYVVRNPGDGLKIEKHMSQFSDTESEMEYARQNQANKRPQPTLLTTQLINYNPDLGFPTQGNRFTPY